MKRYLIAISAMLATLTAAATGTDSIGDILRQIAANNLTLKAQAHESEADVLDIKADNALGGPSVEYSPFFKKGYSGVVESELVVSQEFKFPTKYKDCSRLAGMQRNAGQQQLLKQRRDILLEAELICLDIRRSVCSTSASRAVSNCAVCTSSVWRWATPTSWNSTR